MSLMLASVNSLAEARLVEAAQVDIIDLKQPSLGALGALDTQVVADIVLNLLPTSKVSATVGDLPMHKETVCNAVAAMAETGVDYIKVGIFPGGEPLECIAGLAEFAQNGYALIAVLFADAPLDLTLIPRLAAAGFRGVMLDTQFKQHGSLPHLLEPEQLQTFVQTAQNHALLTGLAGSLTSADIAGLLPLQADYLGFRGALCCKGCRTSDLDISQVTHIKTLLTV
ncbi:(5-formylfuran-3-yl)methyl phosphate synthase [Methylomonas sp. AM2-LC]|uniref:(5-formylfuran-3-yl)methyl phosphate synthase n=1 Tax=Methylomonas sp. AM2-LC TaxID=3153301 RepID=UPI003263A4E7